MIQIYTDGGCIPNPGNGAWAFVAVVDDEILLERCGFQENTTNNRMEYQAAIEALAFCIEHQHQAIVHSDSELLVNTYNTWMETWAKRNWKRGKREVKNLDLVKMLYSLKKDAVAVEVKWIKGHNNHQWNDYADALVGKTIGSKRQMVEVLKPNPSSIEAKIIELEKRIDDLENALLDNYERNFKL